MSKHSSPHTAASEFLPKLWATRLLHHISESVPDLSDDWLEDCPALQLFDDLQEQIEEFGPRQALKNAARSSEEAVAEGCPQPLVERRIRRLGKEIGLKKVEVKLLVFVDLFRSSDELSSTVVQAWEKYLDPMPIEGLISIMLGSKPSAVRKALKPDAFLRRAGLIGPEQDHYSRDDHPPQFAVLGLGLAYKEIVDHDLERRSRVSQPLVAQASEQAPDRHFDGMNQDLAMVDAYLRDTAGLRPAPQILLWGSNVSMLREFAFLVARTSGMDAFFVNSALIDGSARDFEESLTALRFSEAVASKQKKQGLMIAEAVDAGYRSDANAVDLMAASSRVPILWLMSSIENLNADDCVRFDLSIQLSPLETEEAEPLLDALPDAVDKLRRANLDPTHGRRVVQTAVRYQAVGGSSHRADLETFFDHALKGAGELQAAYSEGVPHRGAEEAPNKQKHSELDYDPSLINSDVQLETILESAKRQKDLRILLYGPPGTGKTEFAKQLALRSGRELVIERASGLLGSYVGESERNIQQAFASAEDKVLLIDEVDGLLFSRNGARNNYERSQVGEMLTSMEEFSGIFVATTNDVRCLDSASERRFDVKAKFDFLTLEQKVRCAFSALAECSEKDSEGLRVQLSESLGELPLTPDDFGRARRNARILGAQVTPSFLAGFLGKEASGRPHETKRGIGFI